MKVVVTGAAGMLGQATVAEWRRAGHDVVALTRADLDVTAAADVQRVIAAARPDVLINCTAYNQVDDAEDAPTTALAVNSWAVRHLARAAATANALFVHYSTDFVFDGEAGRPYSETDAPNPQSAYGTSKLVGEWMAADAPSYVFRVESLFGGSESRSTLDRMHATLQAGQTVSAFSDRTVSPSYVPDVVDATRKLVERRAPAGIYHCVNTGCASWLSVAQHLRDAAGLPGSIAAVKSADIVMKAKRPAFAALSNDKLTSVGVTMPTWQDALRRHLIRGTSPSSVGGPVQMSPAAGS